jgi:preprotein translocase subunit YajC
MKKLLIGLLALSSLNSFACDSEKELCVNDKIISDNGLKGKIKAVTPNGYFMVKFKGYNGYNKWPASRLARTKGCTQNKALCIRNEFISDNGLLGTVRGVLPNNQVMVKFKDYDSYNNWPTRRLAPTKGCTSDDYCVGDVIISDNGLKGTIKAISPDQQVMVKFKGYDSYNKWPTIRLSIIN